MKKLHIEWIRIIVGFSFVIIGYLRKDKLVRKFI